MRTFAVLVQYDGSEFSGWQRQPNARTVQATFETALSTIMGEDVTVLAAGRTDARVHALGQVVSFRTRGSVPVERLPFALNANLPQDVQALAAKEVPQEFHATRSAQDKTYVYAIWNRPLAGPWLSRYTLVDGIDLRVEKMRQAARLLEGRHDFRAFSAQGSAAKTTVRTVKEVCVRESSGLVTVSVTADGFLYNMVRIIAGTLLAVGKEMLVASCITDAIRRGKRELLGATAPPHGLWLASVNYPQPVGRMLEPYNTVNGALSLTRCLATYYN